MAINNQISENLNFENNFNKGEFLWKYMDIHKFIYFISKQKLFFTRLDKFNDPLEGSDITGLSLLELFGGILNNPRNFKDNNKGKKEFEEYHKHTSEQVIKSRNQIQKSTFGNCWFIGKRESVAMWQIYSSNDSIAIKAEPSRLIESIEKGSHKLSFDHKIIGKSMKYDFIMPVNEFEIKNKNHDVGFVKDIAYEHENEYRFMIKEILTENKMDSIELPLTDFYQKDSFLVICHPQMENWKVQNLKLLMTKFAIENQVLESEIKLNK